MKIPAALAMLVVLAAACSDRGQSVAAEERRPPPPPPPPSMPNQEQARAGALALGVGSCDDLVRIRTLPFKDELGHDAQFDRMVVNFDGYRECLTAKIVDRTPIEDPAMGPKRRGYTVGNLAYDVIASSGRLDYETCLPTGIADAWRTFGAQALVDWTAQPGHPDILKACVETHLRGTPQRRRTGSGPSSSK
jgi:hypothetical protein